MIEINWNPDNKDLRNFGNAALVILNIVAIALFFIKGLPLPWAIAIASAGIIIFIVSLISMQITRWLYIALTAITCPIGFVVSFIILAAFYYLLLTPVAIIFRLSGRDPLFRNWDHEQKSYWQTRRQKNDIKRYFRQS